MSPGLSESICSDEQLAELAENTLGDAETILIARYASVVKMRASGYYGSGLEPDDLAQEGMIGLMRAIRSYDSSRGASFRTFAILCIDRAIISEVRKRISSVKTDGTVDEFESVFATDFSADPESIVIENESRDIINQKLKKILSGFEYEVFMLYIGGCTYKEISGRLSVEGKSVDNAIYRIKNKLKELQKNIRDFSE